MFDRSTHSTEKNRIKNDQYDDDQDSEHTPKMKKKKVLIAQELSDLIIYTQAVKFRGKISKYIYKNMFTFCMLCL